MLIKCDRHTKEDLKLYEELNDMDILNFELRKVKNKIGKAIHTISNFISIHKEEGYYCSISWGKDSIITADLCLLVDKNIPIVWIKVNPIFNPYCLLVRDNFIKKYSNINYFEYEIFCEKDDKDRIHAKNTLEKGFKKAVKKHGKNHISGIRQEESGIRKLRTKRWGLLTDNTCTPIGYWNHKDVFAYLAYYDLPIHPNYAMLGNGRYKREYIRVASLGCKRGRGFGRLEWEKEYYNDYINKYLLEN